MSENITVNNLVEIAQKMASEKLEREKALAAERVENELSEVQKAVEMVRSGLCYKKVEVHGYRRYVFATEEMLLADYLNEPENSYTRKGLTFNVGEKANGWEHIFVVNGIYYYDMRYLLQRYEQDVKKEKDRITNYNDRLNDLIRGFENVLEEHKAIKKMLEDWNARQNCETERAVKRDD